MSIAPGIQIGGYEVREALGRGSMGVVYRAYHHGLARAAAVKVLQALEPDADTAARFRREAQSIAQMRHPNILQVFDFGENAGVPYMIVEYVPGGSLADRLRTGPPPDRDVAVGLLRGIATGIDYAHSLGVVHRDIKPANVLIGKDGAPILADFGLAKLLESTSVKSMTGMTTGAPAYMSPEQATGSSVGPAADRCALAGDQAGALEATISAAALPAVVNADGSFSVSGTVGAFNFVAGAAYLKVCTFGGAETVCADAPVTLSR